MRFLLLPLLMLTACGDSTKRDIAAALTGGDAGEEAITRLSLSSADVVPAVISAIDDERNPAAGRQLLLELLRRLYVRESDKRILHEFERIALNMDASIRKSVIRALGDVGQTEQLLWLNDHLQRETNLEVLGESLRSISALGKWKVSDGKRGFWVTGGAGLSDEQTTTLHARVKLVYMVAKQDSLRLVAEELLEKFVCQLVQEAEERELGADLTEAEQGFLRALELLPHSRNALRRYAMFLIRNGDLEKGKRMLAANGMMINIPHRAQGPVVDGVLDDPTWENAARIDRHQQTLRIMRTVPDDGQTNGYFVYTDSTLCVGMIQREVDVESLRYEHKERDGWTWQDDHFMLRLMAGVDAVEEYVYFVNPLGTLLDSSSGGANPLRYAWNGEHTVATHIGDDFWSMELELPFSNFGQSVVDKGEVWQLNTGWGNTAISVHAAWIGNHGISSSNMGLAVFE